MWDEELGSPYQILLGTVIVIVLNISGFTLLLDALAAMQKEALFRPNAVSVDSNDLARAYVLVIDRESFLNKFKERTPLDRCELSALLQKASYPSHRLLLIDLDLSPINGASETEVACQLQLEGMLIDLPAKIALMKPYGQDKQDWIDRMKAHGFRFFEPVLSEPFGLLIAQEIRPDSPSQIVREVFGKEMSTSSSQKLDYASMTRGEVIVREVRDEDWPLLDQAKLVLLGGNWDLADTHVTPINDRLPGVIVHAISMNTALSDEVISKLPGWLLNLMGFLLTLPLTAAIIKYARASQLEKLEFRQNRIVNANSIWILLFYLAIAFFLVFIGFAVCSVLWGNSMSESELLVCILGHFLGFVVLRITSVRTINRSSSHQSFRLRDWRRHLIKFLSANIFILFLGSRVEKIGLITWSVKWLLPLTFIIVYRNWL